MWEPGISPQLGISEATGRTEYVLQLITVIRQIVLLSAPDTATLKLRLRIMVTLIYLSRLV